MYTLKIINNKNTWNNFIIKGNISFYSFVDSWEWGEFHKLEGNEVFRYGIFENNELIGLFQLIKIKAKRGIYLFTPHGPLIDENKDYFEVLKDIKQQLIEIAKEQKASFIRLNPTVKNTKENKNGFSSIGFIDAPMHIHAEDTHLLYLDKTEEDLLKNIKKEDRYYINRAIKEGVEVRIDNREDHIKKLTELHQKHANRENGKHTYHAFSSSYIKNLYKVFDKEDITTISTSYNGEIESILMTIKFGKTSVYYIASSDIKSKKFSPNYLCQWQAILNAKQKGCDVYNFWGISPDDNPLHPIAGVTKFKRKFGGVDYSLLHAQDLVVSPAYWFNWIIETIRRKKRGYYYKKPE